MRTSIAALLLILALAVIGLGACGGAAVPATSGGQADPVAGEALFKLECASCHSVEAGVDLTGPSLAGIGTTAGTMDPGVSAEDLLREAITDPNAKVTEGFAKGIMPATFGTQLTTQQINDLIAYLLTLK